MRPVLEGHSTRELALSRYGAFSDAHERKYRWLLNTQRTVGRLTPSRAITVMAKTMANERFCAWAFNHYLEIAPPSFVGTGPSRRTRSARARRGLSYSRRVPVLRDDLQVAHVDAHTVEGPLENRAAEPVTPYERLLGDPLALRVNDARGCLKRRPERLATHSARRDQHTRVVAKPLDLACRALAAHIETAFGLGCPHGRGDHDAAAPERGQQRALVRAQLLRCACAWHLAIECKPAGAVRAASRALARAPGGRRPGTG